MATITMRATPRMNRAKPALTLIACTAAYCIPNATWWLQPILIDQLMGSHRFSLSGAGLVISVEMATMAITASLLSKLLTGGRFLWIGGGGAVLACSASLLSLLCTTLVPMFLSRALVGVGEGVCLMVANTAVVQLGDPDRNFARLGVINVLFGVALVSIMPLIHLPIQQPASLIILAATLCVLAPLVFLMPSASRLVGASTEEARVGQSLADAAAWMRIWLISGATLAIGIASAVLWSFYAIIGAGAGMGEGAVNTAIATAIFSAIPGSGLAALIGGRFGRLLPIGLGLALMSAAIFVLSLHPGATAFRIATCGNVAALYFMMPYFFAAGAAQDAAGRGGAFVSSAFFLSGAVGPFLGAILAETVGTQVMGGVAVTISLLAFATFAYAGRGAERATAGTAGSLSA